jgi:hypothetical protein
VPIDVTVERISPELALVDERLGSAARLALPDVPYNPGAVRAARASEPGGGRLLQIGLMSVLPFVLLALALGLSHLPLSSSHSGAAVAEAASATSAPRKTATSSTLRKRATTSAPRKTATATAASAPRKTPTVTSAPRKTATASRPRKAATVPSTPRKTATGSARRKAATVTSTARSAGTKEVRWKAVPGADYYNVIFRRNGKRALDLWPATASVSVAKGALKPGDYEWFVYPGFRSGGTPHYGPIAASGRLTI